MIKKQAQEINKNISLVHPLCSMTRGRPRLRWRDEVDDDARVIEKRNWWMVARDRDECERFH